MDGHIKIIKAYTDFREQVLPETVHKSGLDIDDLTFNDFCLIIEEFMSPA